MSKQKFEFESIYNLLNVQGKFLKNKTKDTIENLDKIYSEFNTVKNLPKALLFMNLGQLSFEIGFSTINEELDIQNNWEYEFNLNNGESFNIEDYSMYNSKYPLEDYFSIIREEFLENMMKEFFIECYWNSKLKDLKTNVLYSNDSDCDEIIDLSNDLVVYHNFDFLKVN
ncbi:protein of unknown function [Tenacibaculum sp. 190130A14a]|uniref:Uncharacterized protein n=1 Tax=Tenacibaculum polynesiense TaxID=3137857 RepID=A0ABM9PCY5_9FLAO